jgi:hypothetical protein
MLEHLRRAWRDDPQARRDLELAASARARGEYVSVEALPDEREAGRALVYAVLRLAERLPRPPRTMRVRRVVKPGGMEAEYLELSGLGVVRVTADDRYPFEVYERAEALHAWGLEFVLDRLRAVNRPPVERPELEFSLELEPEVVETGETMHFEASTRQTGWGTVFVDGEPVARTRCWTSD